MNIWLIAAIILLVSNLGTGTTLYLKGKHAAEARAQIETLEGRLTAATAANTELVAKALANQKVAQQAAVRELFVREQLDKSRSQAEELLREIERREAVHQTVPAAVPDPAADPAALACPEPVDRGQFTDAELGELQPFIEGAAGHRRQRANGGAPAPVRPAGGRP